MRGAILLVYLAGSLPVCLARPFYGIVLWTILAFANPERFVWGVATHIPWSNLVAITTIIGLLLFKRGWLRRFATPHVMLIGILWLWFGCTTIISFHTPAMTHHADDTWLRLIFVSKVLLMAVMTIALVDDFRHLRILMITIAGCFAFFVFKSIPFIILSGGASRVFGPERSMIGDNNDFGLAMNMTVPVFFCLAQTETSLRWRRFWGVAFIASIPTIFFTYSRGALLGLVAVLVQMIMNVRRRFLILPVLVVGLATGILFAPQAWRTRMDPDNAIDASARSRFNAWTFSWRLAQDYPLAGGGFETFTPELFQRYAPNVIDVHGPHSIYFGVLAEHGFIGLGLYLALVAYSFWTTIRIGRQARRDGYYNIAAYATMLRLSLIGFLTSGMFLGRAYFDYFFTIIAAIIILNRIAAEQSVEEIEPEEDSEEIPNLSLANGSTPYIA